MKVDWNKLDLFDRIFYIIIFILLFVVFFGIIFFVYYFTFYQIKVTPQDTVIISKCSTCDNLIVTKGDKEGVCKWSNSCEAFKNYKYLARIVTPKDLDYQIFKLKYDFYNNKGKNFNKFNEWYKENKDKKFYKYIKTYITIEDRPVYETRYRSVTRHIGITLTTQRMPYSVIVGWKQVPISNEDVKYIEPNDKKYKKVECDAFEYYSQVVEKVGK